MSNPSSKRAPPPLPLHAQVERIAAPPRPLTSFVGREREIVELCDLIRRSDVRLITLTGTGGVGKTRLAIGVASELQADFDSIWFVSLEAIHDPALVGTAIAHALGLRDRGDRNAWERIALHAGTVPALLILDNMEQVSAAASDLVQLLMQAQELTVLVTSRTVLHASGEFDLPVSPLALPPDLAEIPLDDMLRVPAIALFVQRAQAANPRFVIDSGNRRDVVEICTRLEGVPLALELAAAHSRMLSPAAMRDRLGSGLTLLEGGPQDRPSRLRSMRAAIVWSHDLLDLELRTLFRRLAVFVDGFTPEETEAICAGDDLASSWMLTGLEQLLDASLLTRDADDDEPRLRLLETIREYAWERLIDSGEATQIRDSHAVYYLSLAERAESPLISAESGRWLERLISDRANLRAAITWSLDNGRGEAVLRLAGTLLTYGYAHGEPDEGRAWLERAIAAAPNAAPELQADARFTASALAQVQGSFDHSTRLSREALSIARERSYRFGEARANLALGITAEWQNDLDEAAARYETARELMEQVDPHRPRGHWTVMPAANLADIALLRGDYLNAAELADEAVARWRADGYVWGIAQALGTAAAAACARGDLRSASRQYAETLNWWLSCEDGRGIGGTVAGIAAIALARGQLERACRLLGAAWKIGETMGVRFLAHHVHAEQVRVAVRERLDAPTFAQAWSAGQALSVDQAVAEARATIDLGEERRVDESGLTAREIEILRMIATGRSDREIAANLRISPRTVQTHVAHIFFKLGTNTRAESAALAVRRGFI